MSPRSHVDRSDGLIRSIYATLGERGRWPAVLEEIHGAFGATNATLIEHNFGNRTGHIRFKCDHVSDTLDQVYRAKMCGRNPWLHDDQPYQTEAAILGSDLMPTSELMRTDFYTSYLRPAGLLHRLCGVVSRQGLQVRFIALMRAKGEKPFRAREADDLRRILPHLHQAWDLREHLREDRRERDSLLEVLDHVPVACLLVNQGAKVHFLNKAAERLLQRRDGLMVTAGCLTAGTSRASLRLRRTIAKVAGRGAPAGEGLGEHIVIFRASQQPPILLTFFQLHHGGTGQPSGRDALVAVLAKDPDSENVDTIEGFADAYHLTGAETRLVRLLADGRGLFQAAKELQITKNTARTHMRHIYSKVGAHRQADIIRLLAKLGMS